MELINAFLKGMFVVLHGGGNRGKPPTLDVRPLPCHMPIPGIEPRPQRWQVIIIIIIMTLFKEKAQLVKSNLP